MVWSKSKHTPLAYIVLTCGSVDLRVWRQVGLGHQLLSHLADLQLQRHLCWKYVLMGGLSDNNNGMYIILQHT